MKNNERKSSYEAVVKTMKNVKLRYFTGDIRDSCYCRKCKTICNDNVGRFICSKCGDEK